MRVNKRSVVFGLITIVAAAVGPAASTSADTTAVMQFGRPDLGSGCQFPCEDDHSAHAVDRVAPGAVRIAVGDTVEFDIEDFHQVAIYEPGIRPADIEPDPAAFPFVNDPDARIAVSVPTLDYSFTFDEPGKYLVICNITPHFVGAQMWGWVVVG